jgi:hypothetical protein
MNKKPRSSTEIKSEYMMEFMPKDISTIVINYLSFICYSCKNHDDEHLDDCLFTIKFSKYEHKNYYINPNKSADSMIDHKILDIDFRYYAMSNGIVVIMRYGNFASSINITCQVAYDRLFSSLVIINNYNTCFLCGGLNKLSVNELSLDCTSCIMRIFCGLNTNKDVFKKILYMIYN